MNKLNPLNQRFVTCIVMLWIAGCTSPTPRPSGPTSAASTAVMASPTPTPILSSSPMPTSLPRQLPTPTLAPLGEIQPITNGYVYLGDPKEIALGFNLHAGGAIGSLQYHGTEFVDDADFGRYIQFSPYDGGDQYICNSSSCFMTWGWNPLQAGSADGLPARVQEYRRWTDGLYLKALGQEWGRSKGTSDVIYETWAWDHESYFEVHIRMTHTGQDTHTFAGAESPAAYFGAAIPLEYGYTGNEPFTADKIQQYHMATGDMSDNTNPQIFPSENWLAFGDRQGNGLILAVPPQPRLTGRWSMVFIQNAYPDPIGYLTPFAEFETSPGFVFDLTFYLIPGSIESGRSIVYNLIPHTRWTFNLNSPEGWTSSGQPVEVRDGILFSSLSPTDSLTSMPSLNFYGAHSPTVEISAQTPAAGTELCLNFITLNDWNWSPAKSACTQMQLGGAANYHFDLSTNPAWMDGLVTQIRLTASSPVALQIDEIRIARAAYGWEFDDPNNSDGWVAWNQLSPLQVNGANLYATSRGDDPYMGSPYLGIEAVEFNQLEIRMRTSAGNDAQVFFITDKDTGWDEIKSKHFSTISDGAFHTYTIDMSGIPAWKDQIQQIRLDPMVVPGTFEIDYIRIR
ncbi:MAG TPA: hypothetical protein VK249_03605 [Anaerolineales bacterium]|nr:hypothetical protein [Anaerolineales bacterium]